MFARRFMCTTVPPISLAASLRAASGTNMSRQLRASGRVPGVIFGGPRAPILVSFSEDQVEKALAASRYENPAADIKLDNDIVERNVSLHQVLRHPATRKIVSVNVWRGPQH